MNISNALAVLFIEWKRGYVCRVVVDLHLLAGFDSGHLHPLLCQQYGKSDNNVKGWMGKWDAIQSYCRF